MRSRPLPKKRFRFLWVTDPWDTLDHPNESTLRFAEEALSLGYENYWCDVRSIFLRDERVWLKAREFFGFGRGRAKADIKLGDPVLMEPREFSSLQYRTDPPIDLAFLQPLQLLVLGLEGAKGSEIVNPPEVLFARNEKYEGSRLPGLMCPSLVSSQWDVLLDFGRREKRTVLKPLHEAQSKGVELLDWRSKEGIEYAKGLIGSMSEQFRRPVLIQRYLEGIADGEIRHWYLDGKLLASCKKLPMSGDFRVNMDRGSQIAEVRLSARDKKTAAAIGSHLRRIGVRLAAVDVIDHLITDFNFTSPGLITQMEKLLDKNLSRLIVQALAQKPR